MDLTSPAGGHLSKTQMERPTGSGFISASSIYFVPMVARDAVETSTGNHRPCLFSCRLRSSSTMPDSSLQIRPSNVERLAGSGVWKNR